MIGLRRVVPGVGLLCALLATPSSAQCCFFPDLGPPLLVAVDVLMAPPLVANTVYVVKQERPPLVLPVVGFVFGAGGVALGLAFAIPNATQTNGIPSDNNSLKVALGVLTTVEGVLQIAIGIWALLLPPATREAASNLEPRFNWALTPLLGRDRAGGPAIGVALSVGRF